MATKMERLENELAQLKGLLQSRGIFAPALPRTDKERADYVKWGSERHMALLGLVEVEPGDEVDYITHASQGITFRLEDEVTPFMSFADPGKIAKLVLRQKVSDFQAGAPKVPAGAPSLWTPDPIDPDDGRPQAWTSAMVTG